MAMDMATAMATVMEMTSDKTYPSAGGHWTALAVSFLSLLISTGSTEAGDWTLTDAITTTATSVDRTGNSAQSGLVFQVTPAYTLTGRGGRVEGNVHLRPTFSVGTGDTDPRFMTNEGYARGRMEVVEDVFFLGASASARLGGDTGIAGPVDAINVNTDGYQSYSIGLAPEFRAHLNKYADLVSNNSVDYVWYNRNDQNAGSDSLSGTAHIGARSGRIYGPLSWRADASVRKTTYDSRDDQSTSYSAGLGYRLNSTWALNGSLGYETNDVQTSRSSTDGVTWDVGTVWTPNPRNSASFSYGQRYYGDTISGDYTHTSRRTRLSLGVVREVTNRRYEQLVDSFFFLADDQGNPIVDPSNGQPIIVNVPQIQQGDEDYLNSELRGAVSITGRRTNVTLSGSLYQRTYEVSGNKEDGYDLSLNFTRQLGSNFSASAGGSWSQEKASFLGDSDYYDVRFALTRNLSKRTSASLNISHHERDANAANNSYTENRIGISLTSSFL